MICEYGCGCEAKFTLKNNRKCCSARAAQCLAVRKRNSDSIKLAHHENRMLRFTVEHREKSIATNAKRAIQKSFTRGSVRSNVSLKRMMVKYLHKVEKCDICGVSEWQGIKLVLELDHVDGNPSNNEIENLRLLCPNCHSITPTFRGRNINAGTKRVSDETLLAALLTEKNVRHALIKVGLSPRGANYARAYKLSAQMETSDVESVKVGEAASNGNPEPSSQEKV